MRSVFAMAALASCFVFAGMTTSTSASVVVYQLGNHPDGQKQNKQVWGDPAEYGLRLDHDGKLNTFNFDTQDGVYIVFEPGENKVRIFGTVEHIQSRDSETAVGTGELWEIDTILELTHATQADATPWNDGDGTGGIETDPMYEEILEDLKTNGANEDNHSMNQLKDAEFDADRLAFQVVQLKMTLQSTPNTSTGFSKQGTVQEFNEFPNGTEHIPMMLVKGHRLGGYEDPDGNSIADDLVGAGWLEKPGDDGLRPTKDFLFRVLERETGVPPVVLSLIPEPTSAVGFCLLGCLGLARRRRR